MLFRAVMFFAPPAFRREYGNETEAAFGRLVEDRRARDGTLSSSRLAALALADAVRTVLHEWRRAAGGWRVTGGGDVRVALRLFTRQPAHAAAVILTFGITVGALTAAFAFVDPILFRPLPFPDAGHIVVAHAVDERSTFNRLRAVDYARIREGSATLEAVSSYYGIGAGDVAGTPARSLRAVTPGFLTLTGVAPTIGRTFRSDEYRRSPSNVVLITHALWQSTYGGRPDIVGQVLDVHLYGGRDRYEIIGVLPKRFLFPSTWSPTEVVGLLPGDLMATGRGANSLMPTLARLRPGVTIEQAQAEVASIVAEVDRTSTGQQTRRVLTLEPLRASLYGGVGPVVRLIFLGAAAVLLVGCANLAQLLMARLRARQQDLAVRRALGASAARLARMLAAEAIALTVAGGLVAALVARVSLVALSRAVPYHEEAYRQLTFTLDARAWIFLTSVTVAAALLVQAWPIVRATTRRRRDLRDAGRVSRRARAEALFLGTQAAIAMALVVCSLQVVSGFNHLRKQAGGFDPEGLSFLSVWHSAGAARSQSPEMHDLMRRSFEAVQARFGSSIAAFGALPGDSSDGQASRAGAPPPEETGVSITPASASGFDLLGVRLLRGRLYDEREAWSDAPVAVIDRRGADLLFPGQDPIGRQVVTVASTVREIVGVVETLGLVTEPGQLRTGMVFTPFSRVRQSSLDVMFRSADRAGTIAEVRQILGAVHPNTLVRAHPYLPFESALGPPRFAASVLGSLALLALGLSAIGLFGMVAHGVLARTKEIAVRMALGARPRDVQTAIVRTHLTAGVLGLAAGAAIALRATVLLQQVSAGVRPDDPVLFVAAAVILLAVMLMASYWPARRASHIDPAITLKAE